MIPDRSVLSLLSLISAGEMRPGQQGNEIGAGKNDPNQRKHPSGDIGRTAIRLRTPFQIGRPATATAPLSSERRRRAIDARPWPRVLEVARVLVLWHHGVVYFIWDRHGVRDVWWAEAS